MMQKVIRFLTLRADNGEIDVAASRRTVARMERRLRLSRGVTAIEEQVAGVPVRRYSSGGTTPGKVLHLHGGAYFCGSSQMGRRYSGVTTDGGPDMVSVDYRLAPEHPYPAALEDAIAVYRALATEPVAVVGDSAGGGLALALVQRVRDEGLPLPVGLAVYFPWADLTQSGASYLVNAGRDMLTKEGLDRSALLYTAGHDPLDSGVSPLTGSFAGFPRAMITVGTADSLLDDARKVAAALRDEGAPLTLLEIPGAFHGFTMLPVPEARNAIQTVNEFLRWCLRSADGQ